MPQQSLYIVHTSGTINLEDAKNHQPVHKIWHETTTVVIREVSGE